MKKSIFAIFVITFFVVVKEFISNYYFGITNTPPWLNTSNYTHNEEKKEN